MLIRFWQDLVFDPNKFMTEYFKFCGSLVSLLMSFALVSLFWQRRLEALRASRLRRVVLSHLRHISSLCATTKEALALQPGDPQSSLLRDQRINAGRRQLEVAGTPVVALLGEISETTDELLITVTTEFVRDVVPRLVALEALQPTRQGVQDLRNLVGYIEDNVETAIKELEKREDGNEK